MNTKAFFLISILTAGIIVMPENTHLYAQTVTVPRLTELTKPVLNITEKEDLVFLFECAAAWGDYDNDGYLDLITAGAGHNWLKTTILYKNNQGESLTKIDHPFPSLQNASLVWLDYNNDGNLDLFITGIDDQGIYSGLFKNLGPEKNYQFEEVFEGLFEPIYNSGGNKGNRYTIAGDYDNDGWVDIYIQGKNEIGIHSYLYKNEKGLSFTKICPIDGLHSYLKLYGNTAAFGDYNNDGFLDILTGGYSDIPGRSSTGAYYKNNGDGTFSEPVLFEGGVNGEVAWFDYNNDGYLDFVMTGYSFMDGVGWQADLFENSGDETFLRLLPSKTDLPGTQDCSIACGDVNNDGFEDILFLYSHPNALFLNNFGDKTFTRMNLPYGDNSSNYDQNGGMVCLVDFDRDNDLDVFTIGYGGNFLPALLKNDLSPDIPVNNPPGIPENLNAISGGNDFITFSWDIPLDDHTPPEALKYNLFVKREGSEQTMFVMPADLNTGRLKVNENLTPITSNRYKMTGLEDGLYTFGVQAIDNGKLAGQFATKSFSIGEGSNIDSPVNNDPIISYKSGNRWIISSEDGEWDDILVYNMQGMIVKKLSDKSSYTTIEFLGHGVYIARININNELIIKKIVL